MRVHTSFDSDLLLYSLLPFSSPYISTILSVGGKGKGIHYLKLYSTYSFTYQLLYISSMCIVVYCPCTCHCLKCVVCFCVLSFFPLEAAGYRQVRTLHHIYPPPPKFSLLQYQCHLYPSSRTLPSPYYSCSSCDTNQ